MNNSQDTKLIPLTQGKFAIVDADDYEHLALRKWQYHINGYACHSFGIEGEQKSSKIMMHRLIMKAVKGSTLDHINGDRLDNRKVNLRFCSAAQNAANRINYKSKSSKYKGVCWHPAVNRWAVFIHNNKKRYYLGSYESELTAARIYDEAAIKYHGDFAKTNKDLNLI